MALTRPWWFQVGPRLIFHHARYLKIYHILHFRGLYLHRFSLSRMLQKLGWDFFQLLPRRRRDRWSCCSRSWRCWRLFSFFDPSFLFRGGRKPDSTKKKRKGTSRERQKFPDWANLIKRQKSREAFGGIYAIDRITVKLSMIWFCYEKIRKDVSLSN